MQLLVEGVEPTRRALGRCLEALGARVSHLEYQPEPFFGEEEPWGIGHKWAWVLAPTSLPPGAHIVLATGPSSQSAELMLTRLVVLGQLRSWNREVTLAAVAPRVWWEDHCEWPRARGVTELHPRKGRRLRQVQLGRSLAESYLGCLLGLLHDLKNGELIGPNSEYRMNDRELVVKILAQVRSDAVIIGASVLADLCSETSAAMTSGAHLRDQWPVLKPRWENLDRRARNAYLRPQSPNP